MLIVRTGRLWPRDKFEFFKSNPALWNDLKDGKQIEVPDDLFESFKGVKKVDGAVEMKPHRMRKDKDVKESE